MQCTHRTGRLIVVLSSLLAGACGGTETPGDLADAGAPDIEVVDDASGDVPTAPDASPDAEPADASPDAEPADASPDAELADASPDAELADIEDAGHGDAEVTLDVVLEEAETSDAIPLSSELALPCEDTSADIYITPEGSLGADVAPGTVLRCTADSTWNQGFMTQSLSAVGATAIYGVEELRVSLRTERSDGVPGATTAFILLPEPRPTEPMDTIVWAHGTTGLADLCAPSRYPGYYGYLPYVYAAQGYAVIGPDYAGLGNEGVQGYGNARDTAHSLLDAPGALSEVLGPEMLTGKVVMAGYSQGGGAVLNAQALEASYGMEGELVGVIDFAGTIAIDDELDPINWSYANIYPANFAMGTSGGFSSLYIYAHLANALGEDQAGLFFTPAWKEVVSGWIETLCIGDLIGAFGLIGPTVMFDDVFEPSFYAGVIDCIEESESCTEPYAGYVTALQENMIPVDADGARVLMVSGLMDEIVQPTSIACVRDKMQEWGLVADVCVDPSADHYTVVDTHIADALAWTTAVLEGEDAPPCSTQGSLPGCL
jgi:hypothetical protein